MACSYYVVAESEDEAVCSKKKCPITNIESDIVITSANYGVCIKSPNGTLYRLKVNDAGELSTESVS